MSLCIRQRSNRNDDSVSVEELDWSAESQVLIPAEHFCVNLNADLEPKIHYQTPMTCTYGKSFHTLQNCCNRGGNNIFKYTNYVSIFVATVPFSLLKKELSPYFCPYNECTSHWCLVIFGSRSAFKVTPEVFNWDLAGIENHWFTHSMSSSGRDYQVVHES